MELGFIWGSKEVDVVSQGRTVEAALKNLKEAVELHVEEMGVPETSF